MAEFELGFTEEQLNALRECADAEGVSIQTFARDVVLAAIDERSRLFEEAADHVLRVSAELNRRLA